MSLSGYEEQQQNHDTLDETTTEESNATTHTTLETSESYETPAAQQISTDSIQDIDFSNLSVSPSHSTPRPPKPKNFQAEEYPSPYETLRGEVNTTTNLDVTSLLRSDDLPQTPGQRPAILEGIARTPEDSPTLPQRPSSIPRPSTTRKKTDPLLHRVLDKNYRIQATPLSTARFRVQPLETPETTTRGRKTSSKNDELDSSPMVAPPQLHDEMFNSPERRQYTSTLQRTPGVSVLTPARNKTGGKLGTQKTAARTPGIWDSDDEDDGIDEATGMPYGASPPKTMQFHIPQSRLVKTPGRLSLSIVFG